jgi:NAD(P)-dependent dehydrogenase (short-subunit alcohol dehydrogenase family)
MKIEGNVALVTGANRGLGKAFAAGLIEAGAAKVYAGARDPATVTDPRVIPIRLDVTEPRDVAAVAAQCADVNILINNAGVMLLTSMLAAEAEQAMRREMEVNVFGTLRMIHAFAPILARNGGGAIANMLSVVSWFVYPFNATYSTSKHAALAVTEGARIELRGQGTLVVGIHAGFVDTDMAAFVPGPKTPAAQVVERTLQAIRNGEEQVLADASAEETWRNSRTDPAGLAARMQQAWDAGPSWKT